MTKEQIIKLKRKQWRKRLLRPFAEHHVIFYNNKYYKFPNFQKFFYGKQKNYKKAFDHQFAILQNQFIDCCILAETKSHQFGKKYFIEQEKIDGRFITKKLLKKDQELKNKFTILLQENEKLRDNK